MQIVRTALRGWIVLAAAAGVASDTAFGSAWQGPPPAQVRVDAVRLETVQERRRVTGDVRPVQTSLVASREAGAVLELNVQPGSRVRAGDVLATLDRSRLELALATLEAQQVVADATVDQRVEEAAQAHRDVETARELVEKKTVGRKVLTDAESAARVADIRFAVSRSEVDVLAAQRAELDVRLRDTRVLAPFSGVVVDKLTEVGQWVAVGGALVELLSEGDLEVWLDLPQAFAGALQGERGAQALLDVHVEALDRELELGQGRVVPRVDPRARTFKFVLGIPADEVAGERGAITAGMSVTAEVPTGARGEHVTVDRDGILRGETGSFVYVLRPAAEGGSPEGSSGGSQGGPTPVAQVPVRELFGSGGRVVVEAQGLTPGDAVVVEGNERLYPGAMVLAHSAGGGSGEGDEPR